ncbi:MAG: trehalose-phosphatase [Kiloniellales bacterium]|nr:trehalose-phosphatase [Kiloniellales bacterium]
MTMRAETPNRTARQTRRPKTSEERVSIDPAELDAILLDLDGVVTETAETHARAWKATFDEYLRQRAARVGGSQEPFDLKQDYERYVDGKPRFDGVASFLQSRGIYLPPGEDGDPPEKETIRGLGSRKNQLFLEAIRRKGVEVYGTSVDFMKRAKAHRMRVAVVSSSRNCREVLKATGIGELFDAQVDGVVAKEWMLAGKPAPDTFLEAARRLGVKPNRAAVVEDAISGVQAGKAGDFKLVVGVSRHGEPELLRQSGANIVVSDLSEISFGEGKRAVNKIAPSAFEKRDELWARVGNRRVAVFLDYDGTLTPIVGRPELAVLSEEMRETLAALSQRCPVMVISGRDRGDVERLVGLKGLVYAGCHGFDIAGPEGPGLSHLEASGYAPIVAQAARDLERELAPIPGIIVENKTYAVAVHFRLAGTEDIGRVEHIVDGVVARNPQLRKTGGKKVFELRPNMDWDKGKAVLWLLDALDLDTAEVVPLYIGDDVTDQDAFDALHGKGLSILVAQDPQATRADYRLADPAEVGRFLEELTAVLAERAG